MHAKSLQSCLTLCNHMNCSPPGSSVHGILPERTLEWAAIPFSNLHSIDEEKWLHHGKITCSNHKYSQRAVGELDQVPYASDSTAMDFNHSAWEGPPTDHISAELFLMSYSPSGWITDFHTAVGSRQGWMLQNHAQVQLQNGLTQFQLTVCLKWHEQSCQVVDKISQLTFQLLSIQDYDTCNDLQNDGKGGREQKRGWSVQHLNHQNLRNHNLLPFLYQILNANEDEDTISYSWHPLARIRKEVS